MIPHTTITLNSLEQIERLNGLNKLRMDNDEQLFDKVIQNLDKLQQFMKAWFDTHSLEAELFLSKKTNTFPFSVYLIKTTSKMDVMLALGRNGIGRCKKSCLFYLPLSGNIISRLTKRKESLHQYDIEKEIQYYQNIITRQVYPISCRQSTLKQRKQLFI